MRLPVVDKNPVFYLDEYFVDDDDMRLFRAEYRIIKKVVNKLKENK